MKVSKRDAIELVGVGLFGGGLFMQWTVGIAMVAVGALILCVSFVGRFRS